MARNKLVINDVAGVEPTTLSLSTEELGVNTADGKIFWNDGTQIRSMKIGGGGVKLGQAIPMTHEDPSVVIDDETYLRTGHVDLNTAGYDPKVIVENGFAKPFVMNANGLLNARNPIAQWGDLVVIGSENQVVKVSTTGPYGSFTDHIAFDSGFVPMAATSMGGYVIMMGRIGTICAAYRSTNGTSWTRTLYYDVGTTAIALMDWKVSGSEIVVVFGVSTNPRVFRSGDNAANWAAQTFNNTAKIRIIQPKQVGGTWHLLTSNTEGANGTTWQKTWNGSSWADNGVSSTNVYNVRLTYTFKGKQFVRLVDNTVWEYDADASNPDIHANIVNEFKVLGRLSGSADDFAIGIGNNIIVLMNGYFSYDGIHWDHPFSFAEGGVARGLEFPWIDGNNPNKVYSSLDNTQNKFVEWVDCVGYPKPLLTGIISYDAANNTSPYGVPYYIKVKEA